MSEAARSHRSDARVEPYMEPPAGTRSDAGSPLAELAQLVGQDDPFRNMFRKGQATVGQARQTPELAYSGAAEAHAADAEGEQDRHWAAEEARALGLRPSSHEDYQAPEMDGDASHWDESYDRHEADDASSDGDGEQSHEHHDDPASGEGARYAAPPLTPDLWAERAEHSEPLHDSSPAMSDETAVDAPSPRRPLIVLAAVLVLTGGGLAATFLSRPSQGAVANGGSAPTIMAAAGPTKVKQADGPSDAAPVDADAALLSTKVGSSGPVRVVNSQEQPIDLAQLPKSASGPPEAANASSPFPEPKKVKTFLVRPDGSLLNSTAAAPAPARNAVPHVAAAAAPAGNQTDLAAPTPAARPSTPKTGNHGSATPKAAPASIADLAAAEQPVPPVSKPAASKPVEMADASASAVDATASTSTGGNFALQLAASPNEGDARAAFTRLQKKYAELGGFQPTVKKVDSGQKTVYRLRVGNLSQDHAKTLCSHMQASGGSCFVVHN